MSPGMWLRTNVRRLAYRTPLRSRLAHRYPYLFSPGQLRVILDAVDESLRAPGALLEVGCAWGATTVLLNEHLRTTSQGHRTYIVIDTFGGFTARDVDYELRTRGKRSVLRVLEDTFRNNSRQAVSAALAVNAFTNVQLVQADVVDYNFGSIGPIAFALIDVDLFLPVQAALQKVWDQLSPGGVIVVDDCAPNAEWDGALEAYRNFLGRLGRAPDIVTGKLGIIRKSRG